jgi:hypothetical protein
MEYIPFPALPPANEVPLDYAIYAICPTRGDTICCFPRTAAQRDSEAIVLQGGVKYNEFVRLRQSHFHEEHTQ